jgi:hypothetical protein
MRYRIHAIAKTGIPKPTPRPMAIFSGGFDALLAISGVKVLATVFDISAELVLDVGYTVVVITVAVGEDGEEKVLDA